MTVQTAPKSLTTSNQLSSNMSEVN